MIVVQMKDKTLAVILALTVALLWTKIALAAPIDPSDIRVIDGDTIRVFHKQPNVRLVGFNAPETRRAARDAERALGDKATRRVRDLVRQGKGGLIVGNE
jgi:endonuclease YncB( thermonuclease family)